MTSHATATELVRHCPAKVNLALSVGPPRADRLHPIASWMVALTFGDQLTLRRTNQPDSTWRIAFADDAPVPQPIDWPLERDLAYRAHRLLADHVGQPLTVDADLCKRIPAGAGLGGGSSDAAATLVGLNDLFNLNLTANDLTPLAATLGSDVAFLVAAMLGSPSAIVTGVGEHITPAPQPAPIDLVLILPPFTCPTGPVYAAFDEQHPHDAALRSNDVQALPTQHPLPPDAPFNDLAAPACQVQPQLAEAIANLTDMLDQPVHVTGSGAAMFIIAHTPTHARDLAATLTRSTPLAPVATQTLPQ
ncbi:4-(cytidine 5'-diphospho)-2-C-methyl-D-erythritol kinase [Phycisphaerales bacterium AB-hyl4]|uniref:4-diphosphocytidyl-2-C-methyl-D-erythritol kinase n=1 Tax=Natronomicrosphaera hydrolytica TaxID=3242702 RepID=A0ABV4U1U3_9BACT